MSKKVSLRDVAMTVNEFEGTVRDNSPANSEVLSKIDSIKQALSEISSGSDPSDQIFCISDQIICGRQKGGE
jgi:hypothetical protein